MRRRLATVVAVLLACAVPTGCVRLPDEGSVEAADTRREDPNDAGFPFAPPGPQRGESATEIVRHFLDAMQASPIGTAVARKFLSTAAAEVWHPEQQMIAYADVATSSERDGVEVTLQDANAIDSRGSWLGPVVREQATLQLPMTIENGEWRIDRAPDAMIVPDEWFDLRFQQVSLYFFDPAADLLVPEPVFVPRGNQLATALVRGLLRGPGPGLTGVARSFIPRGTALEDLSVPVSADGLARIPLSGDLGALDAESIDLMTVQLAWTLRQDPTVSKVQVTVGENPVTLSGGASEFRLGIGARYDPTGAESVTDLFGLLGGRLVEVAEGEPRPLSGPLSRPGPAFTDVSVNLTGTIAVAVGNNGRNLLTAPLEAGTEARAIPLVTRATHLLHPAWDAADRIWIVDRTPEGAAVSVVIDGQRRGVNVPGITGRNVVDFLVSRDGSRLVAAIDRPGSDLVVVSRIAYEEGAVRGTPAQTIVHGDDEPLQVSDLGWRSPTDVLIVGTVTGELSEVRSVSVDGSPFTRAGEAAVELIREDARHLVSSPVTGSPSWLVAADGEVIRIGPDQESVLPPSGVAALTFVG